jgi:site-specific recombinase XerD
MALSAPELLAKANAAADQRQLAAPTRTAYRRTWTQLAAWCSAENLDPAALPAAKAAEYYAALTARRGASHHLQTKAALSFLYRVLDARNPFAECLAPKFRPDTVQIRHLEAANVAAVLLHLQENRRDYYGHLTFHLAEALFYSACRYHEWATLPANQLVRDAIGANVAVRIKGKGGGFVDLPLLERLGLSLEEWRRFLASFRGHQLRRGGMEFAGSSLLFPGRDGGYYSNQAFNRRLKAACRAVGATVISAHGLRHSAATLLLNERDRNLKEIQELLRHKNLSTTARYTHVDRKRLQGIVADLALPSPTTP